MRTSRAFAPWRGCQGLQRRVVVYTGERSQRTPDGIDLWPVATFLKHLRDGTLWG